MPELVVGILSPSSETSGFLRTQLTASGLATVKVEVDEYCVASADRSARRLVDSSPDIILVDMRDKSAALRSLEVLHSALPDTWFFVTSDYDDPQIIIESMRAGAREFLPKAATNRVLQQALGRYMAEKKKKMQSRALGQMYCVTSVKGGAGTTSVAINSAAAAASGDLKVALLDLNTPIGDAAAFLNLKPKFTVADALESASRLDSVLLDSYMSPVAGMAVLAGLNDFQPGATPQAGGLARILEVASETYTHCFFEISHSLEKGNYELALEICNAILLVVTPELPCIRRAERFIRFLQNNGCAGKIRLIVNRSRRVDEIRDTEIEKAVSHHVFWKLPNDYAACIEAVNSGRPLSVTTSSELARSYRELAQELTGAPALEKRRGLLKLFS